MFGYVDNRRLPKKQTSKRKRRSKRLMPMKPEATVAARKAVRLPHSGGLERTTARRAVVRGGALRRDHSPTRTSGILDSALGPQGLS